MNQQKLKIERFKTAPDDESRTGLFVFDKDIEKILL